MVSCAPNREKPKLPLFVKVDPQNSGINFENTLTETDTLNYFNYGYIYMGGGVSVADFNGDGIPDVFFTGNMVKNRLYLGNGDLTFKDVTEVSGMAGDQRWMQGTTICDINNDGRIDLYISVSGKDEICKNLLFVNQGNDENDIPIFEERAQAYGIADEGHTTNSTFFDYDNDGDLDLFVANYPITKFNTPSFYYSQMARNPRWKDSDHLYQNNGDDTFSDVTESAGVLNFGLTLGISVCDFNQDGYKDFYVSNDFASSDYLYLNNTDGTFTDISKEVTQQTSYYGMGVDLADFNNDGLVDILQVDMAPADNRRIKANMSGMNPNAFYELIDQGLHHQYMYNALQLNRGLDKNGLPVFSNIAWSAGLSSTDWSWAPLFADFDNDGWKDIFISNGTRRDINNNDFFKKLKSEEKKYFKDSSDKSNQFLSLSKMPSEPLSNYLFQNNRDLTFNDKTKDWGLDEKGFSNGVSYSDLDNDGDLDLIINNVDAPASIFENTSNQTLDRNYLNVHLKGAPKNVLGLGTQVTIWSKGMLQTSELTLTRGFQSSIEPKLFFGLNESTVVDSMKVVWPDGSTQTLMETKANQVLTLKHEDARKATKTNAALPIALFKEYSNKISNVHSENQFNDFDFQTLLPHKMSNFGPALATADVNGDGLEDLYIGAAQGANGLLFLQQLDGSFAEMDFQHEADKIYEDIDAIFFDADLDLDLDLYIVSGGNEYEQNSPSYQDRLFINDNGKFVKSKGALPELWSSGGCVRPYDFDNDGDLDLFVGARLDPRNYPYSGKSFLLENQSTQGNLKFTDVTLKLSDELSELGMVTDAVWVDLNADNLAELIVVGEWMPITVFEFNDGKFINSSNKYFEDHTTGWWFSIAAADIDKDGDTDLVIGNLGINYKYQASPEEAFSIYASDFDKNGKSDIVLSYYNYGDEFPVRGRSCSSQQIPAIKEVYKDYNSFSTATLEDIFGKEQLEKALSYKVESFKSVYAENRGTGKFAMKSLPNIAQVSPINDILIEDYTGDGDMDLIVAGNLYASEVETPRSDAGIGLLLVGDGNGNFRPATMAESGILIPYDTKKLRSMVVNNKQGFAVANNNGPLQLFTK